MLGWLFKRNKVSAEGSMCIKSDLNRYHTVQSKEYPNIGITVIATKDVDDFIKIEVIPACKRMYETYYTQSFTLKKKPLLSDGTHFQGPDISKYAKMASEGTK